MTSRLSAIPGLELVPVSELMGRSRDEVMPPVSSDLWWQTWSGRAAFATINFGITARSFKAGEEVTVTMEGMAKGGANLGRITKVILANGKELSMGEER